MKTKAQEKIEAKGYKVVFCIGHRKEVQAQNKRGFIMASGTSCTNLLKNLKP